MIENVYHVDNYYLVLKKIKLSYLYLCVHYVNVYRYVINWVINKWMEESLT